MPIIANVLSSFQPKTSHQTHCIKCSCSNLGEELMWQDTKSLVSACGILPDGYFGRVFYFTASLTQGIFVLSVIEPDIWIHCVPGSAVLSGSRSLLPVTVGWDPERLPSAAELPSPETIPPRSGLGPRRGRSRRAPPPRAHPCQPPGARRSAAAGQHHGQRPGPGPPARGGDGAARRRRGRGNFCGDADGLCGEQRSKERSKHGIWPPVLYVKRRRGQSCFTGTNGVENTPRRCRRALHSALDGKRFCAAVGVSFSPRYSKWKNCLSAGGKSNSCRLPDLGLN